MADLPKLVSDCFLLSKIKSAIQDLNVTPQETYNDPSIS